MARNAITLALYIVANFAMAATWHLFLFADLLDATTPFARGTPIFPLGVSAMVFQGSILIAMYPRFHDGGAWARSGALFGFMAGLYLATGAIWVDVAKFAFVDPLLYLSIETAYELLSFTVLGLLVAFRHQAVLIPRDRPS